VAATVDVVLVAVAVAIVRMGFLEDVDMGLMMATVAGIGGSWFHIHPQTILHRV
jgi:hypothetical protein